MWAWCCSSESNKTNLESLLATLSNLWSNELSLKNSQDNWKYVPSTTLSTVTFVPKLRTRNRQRRGLQVAQMTVRAKVWSVGMKQRTVKKIRCCQMNEIIFKITQLIYKRYIWLYFVFFNKVSFIKILICVWYSRRFYLIYLAQLRFHN